MVDGKNILNIVYSVCRHYFPYSQKTDIDDYCQTIVYRIIKNRKGFKSDLHEINWVFLCARHTAQNILRDNKSKNKRWNISYDENVLDDNQVKDFFISCNRDNVLDILKLSQFNLPARDRNILRDLINYKMLYKDIAKKYKISRRTVYNLKLRLKKLVYEYI